MADFPAASNLVFSENAGIDAATSSLQVLTTGAPGKGAWVELIAATAIDAKFLSVTFKGPADRGSVFDIGIGGAGSEEIIIADLLVNESTSPGQYIHIDIRFDIPAGARISARASSVSGIAVSVGAAVALYAPSFTSPGAIGKVTTYGVSGSSGTAVDSGAVEDTKGAWAEITPSCGEVDAILIMYSHGGNSAALSRDYLFDVGVGGAGSEEIIVENIPISSSNQEDIYFNSSLFPVSIPEGSRIAVRSQSGTTDATDRVLEVGLYGAV